MRDAGSRFIIIAVAMLAGWSMATAPATANDDVEVSQPEDFVHQVAPILKQRCAECHVGEENEGGLSLNTREAMMRGGRGGAAVEPGNPEHSLIYEAVTDPFEDSRMPPEEPMLPDEEIEIIRAWIEAGAPWEEGYTLGEQFDRAPLEPREVSVPEVEGVEHPIDRILEPYFEEHGVAADRRVDDRTYARRVYLDLIGLLPTPEQLEAFESDTRPDKRERLVDSLLANNRHYADHWMAFWNDALRNAYRGTGFIDDGRRQITGWLYGALYHNKPYDEFVRELVSPDDEASEGFVRGIVWRGVVNASQRREMQAAQNISQVFLGTNLKCSSCHDSFNGEWTLDEAYALASVFAVDELEVARCDTPQGRSVEPGFLFPQLGEIDPDAPRDVRVQQLAELVAHPDNGRFTRTIVNRLWERLMGRGIVWPADEMDRPPFSQDLLDWLAEDLRRHDYDLKHTLKRIATSRAYQLRSDPDATPEQQDYVFRGPLVQRMSAEQFVDAISQVTGIWQEVTSDMLERDGRGQGGQVTAMAEAVARGIEQADAPAAAELPGKWVWSQGNAASAADGGAIYLRRTFELAELPKATRAVVTADNQFSLYVNGRRVAESDNWKEPVAVDLTEHLQPGRNVIAIRAINWPDKERGLHVDQPEPNPAGVWFAAVGYDGEGEADWSLGSDDQWRVADEAPGGWRSASFDAADWAHAAELGGANLGPWQAADAMVAAFDADADTAAPFDRIRAVMAMPDPLTEAMGQPRNREQVVTGRDSMASTLQALELTNGYTLNATLRQGAHNWLDREYGTTRELATQLYRTALQREPTDAELDIAVEFLGESADADAMQDLLWATVSLPEFQLIH